MALNVVQLAQRGRQIAQLALIPEPNRPANKATALSLLIALKADASSEGLKAYAARVAAMKEPEPWAAFLPGGPGEPPAAVLLLRPEPDAPSSAWNVFTRLADWTGPGQLYKMLSGKLPSNPLLDASAAVTGPIVRLVIIIAVVLVLFGLVGLGLFAFSRAQAAK